MVVDLKAEKVVNFKAFCPVYNLQTVKIAHPSKVAAYFRQRLSFLQRRIGTFAPR